MSDDLRPTVYEAIAGAALGITSVGKSLKNEQAGYSARSIDDVLDAVHGPLAEAGIAGPFPKVVKREVTERRSNAGKPLYHVALKVRYRFYGPAGDHLDAVTWGEAMDSQDKAMNKAMSAALKMALIQVFTIPVAGDDADRHDPNPLPTEPQASPEEVAELATAMSALWERIGRKAHPKEWRDAGLPVIASLEANGASVVQYRAGLSALDAARKRLDDSGSEGGHEAATEPSGLESPCGVCGADLDAGEPHDADCEAREL